MKRQTFSRTLNEKNLLLRQSDYPGLNELRAIAALCVIPGHVEQMKELNQLPYYYWFPVPGKLGVVLFFALSGFLITALLLKEKHRHQCVSLKNFYIKRALRIWPLYFFLLTFCILVINKIPVFQLPNLSVELYGNLTLKNILLLSFILPNYIYFVIPYASHLWSIGIEEQFYLVQPCIIKVVKHTTVLAGVMLVIVFLKGILNTAIDSSATKYFVTPWTGYFGCIAIGSLGSILCYAKPKFVRSSFITRRPR